MKTTMTYTAIDGKVFVDDQAACEAHERVLHATKDMDAFLDTLALEGRALTRRRNIIMEWEQWKEELESARSERKLWEAGETK